MQHSLLIMMFGQSNADAHNAGPAVVSAALDDPRVVVPNDGRTWQGWRGTERTKPITGFGPAYDPNGKIQSIGAAMGATFAAHNSDPTIGRIITRSGAKGGRPLHGLIKHGVHREGIHLNSDGSLSTLFDGFVKDVTQMAAAARADGMPIRHIYIPFFHGEADRWAPRDDYARWATDLMDEIDGQMCRLGLPTTWMMTQPSGTGQAHVGNGWENRLATVDIGMTRDNAFVAAANYAYPLEDGVHLNATSKALLGEVLGHQMIDHQQGQAPGVTQLDSMDISGAVVDLHFSSDHSLILDDTRFPAPGTPMGFDIAGQMGQSVLHVEQIGARSIRLHCKRPPDGRKTRIDYAYRKVRSDASANAQCPYPLGRGCLRQDISRASRVFPGEELLHWVPGFSVGLDRAAVVEQAA